MKEYQITLADNTKETIQGHIIKIGKGKNAKPCLGINQGSNIITHLASGRLLTKTIPYLSISKAISDTIISLVGEKLLDPEIKPEAFSESLLTYMYEPWQTKIIPTYEEWIDGPDYQERIYTIRNSSGLLSRSESEYLEELSASGASPHYLPSPDGSLFALELRALTEGRPFDCEGLFRTSVKKH